MNEVARQRTETATQEDMGTILAGLAEREVREAPISPLVAAKAAGSLGAARLVVPSIEGHFTKSVDNRNGEQAETDKKIQELEAQIKDDMATFIDLANRISVRQEQVTQLRNHQVRLAMEKAIYAPAQMPQYRPAGGL